MQCQACKNETYIDRIDPVTGKIWYVCVNPRCAEYRKAKALTGEESEAEINK